MLARFQHAWPTQRWQDVTVLVAVSGGADSVALWRLMVAALAKLPRQSVAGELVLAHFNHRLRGAASDEDEQFVRQLALDAGKRLVVERAGAVRSSESIAEEAARDQRYAFLRRAAEQQGARYLVTAHTQDDQVETILHRILRGTGVVGVGGIARTRSLSKGITLIRPLLEFRHQELREYLEQRGQPWREDRSNELPTFTRNRLRNELLPVLRRDYNQRVDEALLRLAASAQEHQQLMERWVDALETSVKVDSAAAGQGVRIPLHPLCDMEPLLISEFLRRIWRRQAWSQQAWTRRHWLDLTAMAGPAPPRQTLDFPGKIRATRTATHLLLTPLD